MENIFCFIIVAFAIIGWYVLIKEIINNYLFKNVEIDNTIKVQIIVHNNEENIEFLTRKIAYIQSKLGDFRNIEIIDNNSSDETYEILEKLHKQYPGLKVRKTL